MYRKKNEGWLKHLDFMLLDMIAQQLAFVIAYNIRFGLGNPYRKEEYLTLAIVYLLVDFVIAILFTSFKNVLKRGLLREFAETVKHITIVEGATVVYLFSVHQAEIYSRLSFYLMIPLYMMLSYIGRILWKRRFKNGNFAGANKSIIIMAPKADLSDCIENVRNADYNIYRFIGAVATDSDCTGGHIGDVPIVSSYDNAVEYICKNWVDEVFLSLDFPKEEETEIVDILSSMGIAVHMAIARADHLMERRQQVERIGNYTVVTCGVNFATSSELALKRLMDIAGGLVGCLITLILVIVIGPVIYLKSPGPIFFSQVRVGRNGKCFKLYKFRTMYLDAEERKKELMDKNRVGDGMMFKLDFDPRIIGNKILPDGTTKEGFGSFLRKASLDEFPQFFNILRGDMSLVGTRPPTMDEYNRYKPHHRARLSFRPGLTGLWQVSGRSNITDFEEVVKLDTAYIDDWSIAEDIRILLKTIRVVFGNDGAM